MLYRDLYLAANDRFTAAITDADRALRRNWNPDQTTRLLDLAWYDCANRVPAWSRLCADIERNYSAAVANQVMMVRGASLTLVDLFQRVAQRRASALDLRLVRQYLRRSVMPLDADADLVARYEHLCTPAHHTVSAAAARRCVMRRLTFGRKEWGCRSI